MALIPVWLLYDMVDSSTFFVIIIGSVTMAPLGLAMPRLCSRHRTRPQNPMHNMFCSMTLALVVNSAMTLVKIMVLDKRQLTGEVLEEILCTVCAIGGIAINTSLGSYLVYDIWANKSGMCHVVWRKLLKLLLPAQRARLMLCDDLEEEAPGHCCICLEPLCDLPPEEALAHGSCKGNHGSGLLRLPCEHTFHSLCAEPWLEREGTCPMCRQPCKSKRACIRICSRTPKRVEGSTVETRATGGQDDEVEGLSKATGGQDDEVEGLSV
jgi:hypothetical protein